MQFFSAKGQHNGDGNMRQLIADILCATAATGRDGCASSIDLGVNEGMLRPQHMKSKTGILNTDRNLAYCSIGLRRINCVSSALPLKTS